MTHGNTGPKVSMNDVDTYADGALLYVRENSTCVNYMLIFVGCNSRFLKEKYNISVSYYINILQIWLYSYYIIF